MYLDLGNNLLKLERIHFHTLHFSGFVRDS